MSAAAKQVADERRDSFKSGLSALQQTDKRAAQQQTLRKDKRDVLMARNRVAVARPPDGETFAVLLAKHYDAQVLLCSDNREASLTQLRILNHILGFASQSFDAQAVFERHAHKILGYYPAGGSLGVGKDGKDGLRVIELLAHLCKGENGAEAARLALTSLVNLTGMETGLDIFIAHCVLDAGALSVAAAHLTQLHSGDGCWLSADEQAHSYWWELVMNVLLSCPEARALVLDTPLFCMGSDDEHAALTAPYMRDLDWVFTRARSVSLVPMLLGVMRAALDNAYDALPSSWTFVVGSWRYLMQALLENYVPSGVPYAQMDVSQQLAMSAAVAATACIARHCDAAQLSKLMLMVGYERVIGKFAALLPFSNLSNRIYVMQFLVKLSALPLREHEFQLAMEGSGCIPLMLQQADHTDERVRLNSFLWMGNYAADGTAYVQNLMLAGALRSVSASIRDDRTPVRRTAIYALRKMFMACEYDFRNKMDVSAQASGLIHRLVVTENMFRWLRPHIGIAGSEETTCDILQCAETALRWNRPAAQAALEESGTLERAMQMLDSPCTPIYEAVSRIDELLHGRVQHMQIGFAAAADDEEPGVVMGSFNF